MNRRDAIRSVMALPAVASISVAQLNPDDVIVMECDGDISQEALERIKATTLGVWPGQKVVVLGNGLHMKVVKG